MRILATSMLFMLLVTQSDSAQAADLNGAWTIDAASCAQVFKKEHDKLAFRPDADLNAGGLIVDGKRITGTFQKCTVKSSHGNGSNMKVIASCSDGVSVSDVEFDLKLSGQDSITLSRKDPVPVEMPYVRCAL